MKEEKLVPGNRSFKYECNYNMLFVLGNRVFGQALTLQDRDYAVSEVGERGFAALGLDLPNLRRQHRLFARRCIDWSERRPHIGGALGAALMKRFQEDGWLRKSAGQRQIWVTSVGQQGFWKAFGIQV